MQNKLIRLLLIILVSLIAFTLNAEEVDVSMFYFDVPTLEQLEIDKTVVTTSFVVPTLNMESITVDITNNIMRGYAQISADSMVSLNLYDGTTTSNMMNRFKQAMKTRKMKFHSMGFYKAARVVESLDEAMYSLQRELEKLRKEAKITNEELNIRSAHPSTEPFETPPPSPLGHEWKR